MMDTLRALTGWVLFLVMAVLAAFFWHQSDTRGQRIEELTIRILEIDAQINQLTDDIISLREHMNENQSIPGSNDTEVAAAAEGELTSAPAPSVVPAP